MDVAGTISAVTAAIGFARELNSVDVQVDQAVLKLKVAELTATLADTKLGLIDVAEELRSREAEIERLAAAFTFKADHTESFRGLTYELSPDGKKQGLPFCPVCETKGQYHRLVVIWKEGRPHICPNCKADIGHVAEFAWP